MELYRYISFQSFCELVFNSELTFKQPKTWPDQYEGYIYRLLDTDNGKSAIKKLISEKIADQSRGDEMVRLLQLLGESAYCVCFSRNRDKEVMWNAYGYNGQAVMIEVDDAALEFSGASSPIVLLVEYDLEKYQMTFLKDNISKHQYGVSVRNAEDILKHKRACFAYEQEVRMIMKEIAHPNEGTMKYEIRNISAFITGVMVHPLATAEYAKVIEMLCSNYGLKYLGKSKVYDFEESFFHDKSI